MCANVVVEEGSSRASFHASVCIKSKSASTLCAERKSGLATQTVICACLAFLNSVFGQYYLVRVAGADDTNIGLCLQQFRRRT